jgi:protocatechuate 3,4-dioxygenase alpha subunit
VNETPSQTIGPFFRFGLDWAADADLVLPGSPGARELRGVVYDGEGLPVPDAMIEMWQQPRFGRALTEADGSYRFTTVKPPNSGLAGYAPHIDVSVFARGLLQRLVTRIYFPDEADANAIDAVLASVPTGRRATLVAGCGPGGLLFDVHLQGSEETVFFAY